MIIKRQNNKKQTKCEKKGGQTKNCDKKKRISIDFTLVYFCWKIFSQNKQQQQFNECNYETCSQTYTTKSQ